MAFRLRKDAHDWFKHIRNSLSLDFDMYYLCLMAGLTTRRKEETLTAQTTELVGYFPGEYQPRAFVIIALFLSRELQEMGIHTSDRAGLNDAISGLVDPYSSSHLSDEGMRQVNKYAYGGYEVLNEWFEDRPQHIETFLPQYKEHIDQELATDTGP